MTNTIENGCVNGNLKAFVIPNSLSTIEENMIFADRMHQYINEIANISNLEEAATNDKLVQVWMYGMDSDNFIRHGFRVTDEKGKIHRATVRHFAEYLPAKWFNGMKEGDSIEISLPATIEEYNKNGECSTRKIKVHATLTLSQLDSRYRRFGTFENALADLLNA